MKKIFSILICLFLIAGLVVGCSGPAADQQKEEPQKAEAEQQEAPKPENPVLRLATTTSTQDTGLLDELLPVFEEKTGYDVDVLSMGTGKAIKTAELGDADVILVHARAQEDKFVEDGFGVNRQDVMYNDFVILGPADDSAGIKGLTVQEAMQRIADSKVIFVSRGDNSGTHSKEKTLWDVAGITPEGDWYQEVNKGMGDTLNMANEQRAYTLADRGTFIKMEENIELVILLEGDENLFNPYGIIAVNPEKHAQVNYEGAMSLIDFMTCDVTKDLIGNFQLNGKQLFYAQR